jgi:hypoxanthine-DNA glycosylase
MNAVIGFPPVIDASARVLILGSMPGVASLQRQQYYAHKRNSFWKIVGGIFGFDPAAPYEERLALLRNSGVALWDVLHSCVRPGSLDGAIERDSKVPNDFAGLFRDYPGIRLVCCNGAEAHESYQRLVLSKLGGDSIPCRRLPSTSPAHAALPFEDKLAAWREALS